METGREPDGALRIALHGRLDIHTAGGVWADAVRALDELDGRKLVIDAAAVSYCDGAGVGLLVELCRRRGRAGAGWEVRGLRPEFQHIFNLFNPDDFAPMPHAPHRLAAWPEEVGRAVGRVAVDLRQQIGFVGELSAAVAMAIRHPGRVRWGDILRVMELAGVNALPIVARIGLLLGLILAFQSAIALSRYGAELFVANLVALSLFRELGPLMTAIILTARSGSAFAAEIGTMKVNEEVDALITMGLDPVRFLVVPRVLGAVVVTPLLTVFANLFGLIGAAVVVRSLGYPLVTYVNQVVSAVNVTAAVGGLVKAFVFGVLVAAVGCLRGLQTQSGASAVGDATTRAVVSGIVLIVLADGLFSVLFYYLGV